MATLNGIKSGSLFIENPIIVEVVAGNFPQTSFHRVKLKVFATLEGVDTSETDLTLSSPALSGETIRIDISSALRSVAEKFNYERESVEFPYLSYYLRAWDEYMVNGELHESDKVTLKGFQALLGGFSARERYLNDGDFMPVKSFSTKPKTGEIVALDETLVYPVPFPTEKTDSISYGQKSKIFVFREEGPVSIHLKDLYNPATDYGQEEFIDEVVHNLYVVPASKDRFHFYFVNRRGVVETIAAQCLPEINQKTKSMTQVMNVPQTFKEMSRTRLQKRSEGRTYKMSSGPLNKEWLAWWVDEFLMTEKAWVRIDGNYFPCNIQVNENTLLQKCASDDVLEVEFTVNLDL